MLVPAPVAYPALAGSAAGPAALDRASAALAAAHAAGRPDGPLPPGMPGRVLAAASAALGPPQVPEYGHGEEFALHTLATVLHEYGVDLTHPLTAAHLQPPPLAVAVAADALASAGNASLDTYDSGPAAIAVERWVVRALAGLAALGERADGVLTPGGSMSNLLGLLLARDAAGHRRGVDVRQAGTSALPHPVVLCSELAHFSVLRACATLGLGERAVRALPVDEHRRLRPDAVHAALRELGPSATPVAVVATAGTTDFGSVDPLPSLAEVCAEHGVWLHVDAAYGFGALCSEHLAERLTGLELADSITADLHKLLWQPASASALLVSDPGAFAALERTVEYLNPADDADAGFDGLLGRSLQTTRRPDAVKVAATLLAYGRRGLGELVDACHDLAWHAARRIAAEPELELLAEPVLTTVVFRYRGSDHVNGALRRRLLESGTALIGRTSAPVLPGSGGPPANEGVAGGGGRHAVCLKFTLLNPSATAADVDELVDAVLRAGRLARTEPGPGEGAA